MRQTTLMEAQRERALTSENAKKDRSINGSGPHSATMDPWEQSHPDPANSADPLLASKLTKSEAEISRQTIANEILEAAKTVCGELIADTERTLEKAKYLEGEADRKHVEAHEERERAAEIRHEAEEYRESLIEDAKRQSAEHIERAHSAVERECSEMKQRASIEAEKMTAHAHVMRAAALEELEAQKIYAEAARFKAASRDTLEQARNRLDDARTEALLKPGAERQPKEPTPAAELVKNNVTDLVTDPRTDPAGHQGQIDRATAIALGTIQIEPHAETSNGHTAGMDSLEELRGMQEAASKAVDAALAQEQKPAKQRSTTKRKKTATDKT